MLPKLLVALVFPFLLTSLGFSYCIELSCDIYDWQTCDGVLTSRGKDCTTRCICVLPSRASFLDTKHPGILTTYRAGRVVVSGVVPGSPGARQGVLPGDEVERINGIVPGTVVCPAPSWDSGTANQADLRLRRGGQSFNVVVDLVPVRALLDSGWSGKNVAIRTVSGGSGQGSGRPFYDLGILLSARGKHLVVEAVLRGSPAESARVRVGDQVRSANGKPIRRILASFSSFTASQNVQLTIERDGVVQTKLLRVLGPSQLLRSVGEQSGDEQHVARVFVR